MQENKNLTAEEKLALIQLVGISNTMSDIRKHFSSYLETNIETPKKEKEVNPPIEEQKSYKVQKEDEPITKNNFDDINIGNASIYDSRYLDLVKEDMQNHKEELSDLRKTAIEEEPNIKREEKPAVLERKVNPWDGLRTVRPGE